MQAIDYDKIAYARSLCNDASKADVEFAQHYYATALKYLSRYKPRNFDEQWITELGIIYQQRCLMFHNAPKGTKEFKTASQDLVQALDLFKKAIKKKRYLPAMKYYGILMTQCNKLDEGDKYLKSKCDKKMLNPIRTEIGKTFKREWIESEKCNDRGLQCAQAWLQKAADEGYLPAVEQRGLLYMDCGYFQQAEESLSVLVNSNYHLGSSFYNMGICRKAMQDDQGAACVWHMAVELEKHADAAFALGHYYKKIGQREEARKWFNKAAEYRNDN